MAQPTWQRRQAISAQRLQRDALPALLKELCQSALLALGLDDAQLLDASLPDQFLLRRALASQAQQADYISLVDERELWVRTADVALPVWVVGNVCSGQGDGVDEGERLVGSWGWVAELRVQWYTVGSGWVDGQEAADAFPDASGLDCVFLHHYVSCEEK